MTARSLYTRRPMAPIGVEVGWLVAPAMGDYISRMDASWAHVCFSFAMARSNRIRVKFWAWFMEAPMKARSLYARRPMAPVGVEIVWRGAPAMGNFIARMDASRARVCISFGVA